MKKISSGERVQHIPEFPVIITRIGRPLCLENPARKGTGPVLYYDDRMRRRNLLLLILAIPVVAQEMRSACAYCAAWNKPHQPFRIYGNTYYVGTHGLSSILIASEGGHILIDGALPES